MARKLLDTGILLHYARNSDLYKQIEAEQGLLLETTTSFISIVSIGEIRSLMLQRGWGAAKGEGLLRQLQKLVVLDITSGDTDLLNSYIEIDCWSKNKLPNRPRGASDTMGKNDLWIAATAHVLQATLITTDGDFNHLQDEFLQVKQYKAI